MRTLLRRLVFREPADNDAEMRRAIARLRAAGFQPAAVIDVGAHVGAWSRLAHGVFPDADYHLVEADPEKRAALGAVAAQLGRAHVHIGLVGASILPAVTFHRVPGLTGSSVLPELTSAQKTPVTLPMTTLDVLTDGRAAGPVLLKLDVQGFELEVLKGAASLLRRVGGICPETSTLPYNEGAPLFADVDLHLSRGGFVLYDVVDLLRRSSDQALFQMNALFVPADSPLRAPRAFWEWENGRRD
jgi:FkbM family methyltransferase